MYRVPSPVEGLVQGDLPPVGLVPDVDAILRRLLAAVGNHGYLEFVVVHPVGGGGGNLT